MMACTGTYQRIQDNQDGNLLDIVQIEIEADTPEEKMECLQDLALLHEILEEFGVYKPITP